MNVQVIKLAPIPVVMLRHRGPYEGLSAVFEKLWGWVEAHNVPVQRTIGMYWDNADHVPASQLRSAACVEIPPSFLVADRSGLDLELGGIAGGEYATMRMVGPYEGLGPVWAGMTGYVEGTLRRSIGENPAFEVYVNDASETPPHELITELYLPVL